MLSSSDSVSSNPAPSWSSDAGDEAYPGRRSAQDPDLLRRSERPSVDLGPEQRLAAIGRDLVEAVRDGTFEVNWQPVVRLADAVPSGYEGLLRWNRRGTGYLPPDLLAAVAAKLGVTGAVDRWLLGSCCRAAASWPVPLWVSVRLTAPWFACGDLPGLVSTVLAETGLQPCRMKLGLPADALGNREAGCIVAALRAIGVGLVIDRLRPEPALRRRAGDAPFATVKLDRRVTRDLVGNGAGRNLLGSTVALAHDLGLAVCADGVDDVGQRDLLMCCGCDLGQGDLFGYPTSVPTLRAVQGAA